jgi:hypothetical protein
VRLLLVIYAIGVVVGLWRTDGPPAARAVLALLWPIGPLAFLVTIVGLLLVGLVAAVAPRTSNHMPSA